MPVQDLSRFAAFEDWGLQFAPEKKPKARRKSKTASSAAPPIAVETKQARARLLTCLLRIGRWIADAAREEIAEWFRGLRQKIIAALLGLVSIGGAGGYAHQEFNLFGLKHGAPPPVAANDNMNNWKTEVHRAPRAQGRNR